MGPDFVYGFINAMDGERDPRILVMLFDFLPKFLQTFPLGHLDEEAFEVIACYFPIDFNPSPNDAGAVTRELLAEKLAKCLCAHESFAEGCLNLFIEKLDSSVGCISISTLIYILYFNQFLFIHSSRWQNSIRCFCFRKHHNNFYQV